MCNLAKFTTTTAAWLAEEQLNELLTLGNTTLVSAALGLSGLGFEDVLAAKESSFSLLDGSKRAVLNELQSNSGVDYLISMTLNTQAELVEEIDEIVEDLQEKVDGLKQTTSATPSYSTSKPSLDKAMDDMKKLFSSVRRVNEEPETAGEALQGLVNQGLISQESLDEYLQETPLLGRSSIVDRRQVVKELRDRYYTIERRGPRDPVLGNNIELGPKFKIVDEEGNEVDGIAGYEAGELSNDGTISLRGTESGTAQNANKTLRIQPEQKQKISPKTKPKIRVDLSDVTQNLQEEMYYEVWACLILDIVSYLRSTWDRVTVKMDRLLDILFAQQNVLKGTPTPPVLDQLNNKSFRALNKIKRSLQEIIEGGGAANELLSIQNSLISPGLPGGNAGRSICDFNHDKYCDIHRGLLDFINAIDAELDLFNFSFGGLDIGDLDFDLKALIGLLVDFLAPLKDEIDKIGDLIDKLQGDICAFAARRMKGVPKNLSAIEAALIGLRTLIAAAPSFLPSFYGIAESAILGIEAAKLIKAGYVAAAAALLAGDIYTFLAMDERDSTYSGQVANCLAQAAGKCPDSTKARRMRELAAASRARSDQKITGQRIREGARRRKVLNNSVSTARQINIEAIDLIASCAARNV